MLPTGIFKDLIQLLESTWHNPYNPILLWDYENNNKTNTLRDQNLQQQKSDNKTT